MERVALYCRVSSDDQKERDTIENQVEILNTYAEMNEHMEVIDEYLDNGVSGTIPFIERPGSSKLIKDASNGKFDTVLVWKVDRFGRDTLSGLVAVEMLNNNNIKILSITEPFDLNTPIGRFQFINYLNMAELDRNNILDRMYLGATRAAKQGRWLGGVIPYGYTVNKEKFFEINEKESLVVKKIFDLYVNDRLNIIPIAIYLNNEGIPTNDFMERGRRTKRAANKWRSTTVNRIINNTMYMGVHYYGKRGTRRKDLIKRSVPAIITEDLWNKAQIIKKENISTSKRNIKKREYLLRGLIECKICGKHFYGVSYKNKKAYYVCAGKRGENKRIFGIKCNNLNINAESIESSIWNDCIYILKHYEDYIKDIQINSVDIDNTSRDELEKLEKNLNSLKNERIEIITLRRKKQIKDDDFNIQIKDIESEQNQIIKLVDIFKKKNELLANENELISNTANILKKYQDKINNLTFEDKYKIVRILVKKIEASVIMEDGIRVSSYNVVYNLVKLDIDTDVPVEITDQIKNVHVQNMKERGI
jgi:site-specific DNA recombinase